MVREVTLQTLGTLLRRHALRILVGAAGGAAVVGVVLMLGGGDRYSARAQLVLAPPKLASTLAPDPLTVQGYQSLLESPAVIAETERRLREGGVIGAEDRLELGKTLETRIHIATRSEEALSPLLEVQAVWTDPEAAARIANTWAEVFLERGRERRRQAVVAVLDLVERQYPENRERQERLAIELGTNADKLRLEFDETVAAWERRHRVALLAASARFAALAQSVIERLGVVDPEGTGANLRGALLELVALRGAFVRQQRMAAPPVVDLGRFTAPSIPTGASSSTTLSSRASPSMYSRPRPADAIAAASLYDPFSAQLGGRVAELEAQLAREAATVGGELQAAMREHTAEAMALQTEQELALASLERGRDRELASLMTAIEQRLASQQQEATRLEQLGELLAENQNQASLARAQLDLDEIVLASTALPADRPISAQRRTRVVLGGIAGAIAAVLIVGAVERRREDELVDTR